MERMKEEKPDGHLWIFIGIADAMNWPSNPDPRHQNWTLASKFVSIEPIHEI